MAWLITGGAGYIGAHVVRDMLASGREVVVLDDLSTGRADRLPDGVPLLVGEIGDRPTVVRALTEHPVTGVMHFAARKQVGESVERPLYYWSQNMGGLQVLLEEMVSAGVRRMVFSSSAAVYGQPELDAATGEQITETTHCAPINPYGATKLAGEWMVSATARAHDWRTLSLRYFNVAGAGAPELGDPAALNLIPMVLEALAAGRNPRVFGDDYPTADGSCIRDYIHVADLSAAHVAAAAAVEGGAGADGVELPAHMPINIGTGQGNSVLEVIDALRGSLGQQFPVDVVPRRAGDPPALVASPQRASTALGWSARHSLTDMTDSAWAAFRARG